MGDLVLVAILFALALGLALGVPSTRSRLAAGILGALGAGLLLARLVPIGVWVYSLLFYLFAAITVVAAVCAVSLRHPIYCAVWFGVMFLGTAGLLLLIGAQFLAVATLVIYAGAILVIFLFVLMFAQPEGRAHYDIMVRRPGVVALVAMAFAALIAGAAIVFLGTGELAKLSAPAEERATGVLQPEHVAALAEVLFSRHLIALEVVGIILLVALIGAALIGGRAEGSAWRHLSSEASRNDRRKHPGNSSEALPEQPGPTTSGSNRVIDELRRSSGG